MARTKAPVDLDELQNVIIDLESQRTFSSPHKLYEAIAQTDWAKASKITAVMVYLRVKEANPEGQPPGIIMKVQPARRVGPKVASVAPAVANGDGAEVAVAAAPAEPRRSPARTRVQVAELPDIQVLLEAFANRGVAITGVESLMTSAHKPKDQNRAILLAWCDLRDALGCPKPMNQVSPKKRAEWEAQQRFADQVRDQEQGENTLDPNASVAHDELREALEQGVPSLPPHPSVAQVEGDLEPAQPGDDDVYPGAEETDLGGERGFTVDEVQAAEDGYRFEGGDPVEVLDRSEELEQVSGW
jgi:hypothetical protein